jgi:hypothetical protein
VPAHDVRDVEAWPPGESRAMDHGAQPVFFSRSRGLFVFRIVPAETRT